MVREGTPARAIRPPALEYAQEWANAEGHTICIYADHRNPDGWWRSTYHIRREGAPAPEGTDLVATIHPKQR